MDKMRWRYGDTNPVVAAVDADTVIEIGDLLWQDIDDAKPATSLCGYRDLDYRSRAFCRQVPGRGHAAEQERRYGPDPRGDDGRVRVRLRAGQI